jgi:hypothetical protein
MYIVTGLIFFLLLSSNANVPNTKGVVSTEC